MASDNDDHGTLIVCLIILGMSVSIMIYCGIHQMMHPPVHRNLQIQEDQNAYMRELRQRSLQNLWHISRSGDSPLGTEAGSVKYT